MKKRVIICGYPKSGTTWLTRLTAELLGCPVVGFWCEPFNKEESIEGLDRKSEFQCFKAHHTFKQMNRTLRIYGNGTERIIYIYRDPRSVVVSAAHFWRFDLDGMTRGLINGTAEGSWLTKPWKKHVTGYQNRNKVLMMSYERLRIDPMPLVREISRFLSVRRTDKDLMGAIQAQSFSARMRTPSSKNGTINKSSVLRRGEVESWKVELPSNNVKQIEQEIGGFMRHLGYHLSTDHEQGASVNVLHTNLR